MLIINFILGLLPIIWLVIALCGLKWPGYKAALGALIIAAVEALTYFGFSMSDTLTSILEGFAFAMWPIVIVIIAAVFTYNLSLRTGSIDMIKKLLTSVSADKRVLVLLIGWSFGGFMEAMAGFGTAVAIPASMLWVLDFDPILACLVCLVANATPTPVSYTHLDVYKRQENGHLIFLCTGRNRVGIESIMSDDFDGCICSAGG